MFGLFGKKSETSALRKHAERAANKRAQAIDRWDAIQALARMRTVEAVAALLPRFAFYVEPSITDQEEKDAAFEAIVALGDASLAPVATFLKRTDSISWPIKILDRLTGPDVVVGELLALLADMDTEYARDPQKKIQSLAALEERSDPRIAGAVARFLADANETVRFHAVGAIVAQPEHVTQREALLDALCREESVRVKHRILDRAIGEQWELAARRDEMRAALPSGYELDAQGHVRKS